MFVGKILRLKNCSLKNFHRKSYYYVLWPLYRLRLEKVGNVFEELIEDQIFPEEAQLDIVNYFEDVWVGRRDRRDQRRQPHYLKLICAGVAFFKCFNGFTQNK